MSPPAFYSLADEVKVPLSPRRSFLSRSVGWTITGLWSLFRILLIAWGTLAIYYYSNLPWTSLRLALAGAFAGFAVWASWLTARRAMSAVFLVLFAGVVAWWISISPSHDRPWRPEVAVMPRAIVDGDRVRIMGVRNFDYRSVDDFTVRYEERGATVAFDRGRFLRFLLDQGAGRAHVPELHFRQCPAAEHLNRDPAGGGRGLRPSSGLHQLKRAVAILREH
jgi:hypothetical protein